LGRIYTIKGGKMKIAHNKVNVDRETKRKIRSLFFKQVEMKDIVEEVKLTERIIRRVVNENNWIEKRERYLRFLCNYAYIHDIPLIKMAEKTKVMKYALNRVHKKYKTLKPKMAVWNKRISDDVENKFIEEYNDGSSSQKIANKYGYKTDKTVLDVLKKNGINRRAASIPTFYDTSFFEQIDSHEKAYVLGLIMTDGYVIKDYMGFGIQLTKEDGYILEKIAEIIGAIQGVSQINCDSKRKKMPTTKDMVRLTVHNRKISEDLKKMGVVKNKSKTLRYNNVVPKQYSSSFFRGLIDGDGCIHVKGNRIQIQLASASKLFIEDLKCVTDFNFSIHISGVKYKNSKSVMFNLYLKGGAKERIRFLKWIYEYKGDLYLRRKYAKVQNKIS
jgi:hypothetical protein